MKNSVCSFVLMLLCVVLVASTALLGIDDIGLKSILHKDAINKGLDLVGGSSITYKAIPEEDNEEFDMDTALVTVENMLRQRLETLGYSEAVITRVGTDKMRVEIPGIADPNEASEMLGQTAKLQFLDSNGKVLFEGDQVKSAVAMFGQTGKSLTNEHYVSLEFNSEGAEKFAQATQEMSSAEHRSNKTNYIDITLDGNIISHASVDEAITGGSCSISGGFDEEGATYLAELITAGQLPVELKQDELRFVAPTLGNDSFDTSIKAGAIGILLVMLFMILVYRLPGLISAISLVSYVGIFGIFITFFNINLSLPGIAGIILTIGMAVDANVVIYERIKEELNAGKTVRSAVRAGFGNAFSAIIDSNITTIIAAIVLIIFGVGSVRGFAITLLVGVLISLFTALVVTRVLLYSLSNMGVSRWLMGAKCKKCDNAAEEN